MTTTNNTTYVPTEIWRSVLEYHTLPSTSATSTMFHDVETSLEQERIDRLKRRYNSIDDAIEEQDKEDIKFMIKHFDQFEIDDLGYVAIWLGGYGWRDTIQDFLEKYASTTTEDLYSAIANGAASNGLFSIVQWMNKMAGSLDYQLVAEGAAAAGHLDIIEWCIKKGANNYDNIATEAAHGNQMETVLWLLNYGVRSPVSVIGVVASMGSIENLKLVLPYISQDDLLNSLYRIADMALPYRDEEEESERRKNKVIMYIVDLMLQEDIFGAVGYIRSLIRECIGRGNFDMADYMIHKMEENNIDVRDLEEEYNERLYAVEL